MLNYSRRDENCGAGRELNDQPELAKEEVAPFAWVKTAATLNDTQATRKIPCIHVRNGDGGGPEVAGEGWVQTGTEDAAKATITLKELA